ncbi:MAG TPA: hypothetical protein VNY51_00540 [Candidatus Dormibacteraeota bacterium]|nr:hypothetical protein [Candidatus Dormibacteraeota bacterium]
MNDKRHSERLPLILCILLGTAQAWISRYAMNQDGTSYLDVGDAFFRGDWAKAISGYWSPMYCWWVGLALHVVKPSIWWEFATVQAANLIIYFVALFCFRFLLHSIVRALREEAANKVDDTRPLPDWVVSWLGYGIFLWASLVLIDVADVTPDLLVAAFVFLIGGYLVDLRYRESYPKFAVFGILCGAAYLTKAAMFLVSFGLLVILLFSGKFSKRRALGVMLAGLMFLVVSLPFIAALSKQKGRLTFGDSGRLAYASMVNPNVPQKHWQGDPPEGGVPKHTTRQVLDDPAVFEFAEPVGGTYPPWYDPSYWNEGAHGTFRLRAQIRVLVQSARNYAKMFIDQLGLFAGIGILVLWGGTPTRRAIVANWPLIAAAALNMGLYSIVLVRPRYVGGFVALLCVALLAGIRLPRNAEAMSLTKYMTIAVTGTILLSVVANLAETAYVTDTVYGYPTQKDEMRAAEGLQNMGLRAGDPVAVIGDGTVDYWARLDRFKLVAEIFSPEPNQVQFWSEPWERRKVAYECLRRAGARVVVVWSPPHGVDPGWEKIANTNYYAYLLQK